jgi:hypothetical protein
MDRGRIADRPGRRATEEGDKLPTPHGVPQTGEQAFARKTYHVLCGLYGRRSAALPTIGFLAGEHAGVHLPIRPVRAPSRNISQRSRLRRRPIPGSSGTRPRLREPSCTSRRDILWLGATARPNAEWIARQLTEAMANPISEVCTINTSGLISGRDRVTTASNNEQSIKPVVVRIVFP